MAHVSLFNLCLHIARVASFSQSFELKPSTLSVAPSINLTIGDDVVVDVVSDVWSIDVASQYGADIAIQLQGPEWGFHPQYPSTITLNLGGNTSNATYIGDGEINFVFSVEEQHFPEMISLDNRASNYKECPMSGETLLSRDVHEMIYSEAPYRLYRYCNNTVDIASSAATDLWTNVANRYKLPAKWPMFQRHQ